MSGVCVCVVESWARLALRNWFGGEGGRDWGVVVDWTRLGRIGLDWIDARVRVRCKMQDAGSAEKDQAGMKGSLNEWLRG